MTKVPVLVTGGAGYIGSHAVLALKDAGWPVSVIDNLTTGFRFAIPDGVPFYQGDIEDGDLLARIIAEQGSGGDALRRIGRGARIGREPAEILPQQHRQEPRADQIGGEGRRAPLHLQLDRGDLWRARGFAGDRGQPQAADQSLWHVQADDRDHAGRHRPGASAQLLRAALFQRGGRRSGRARASPPPARRI
jgi:NAD(P)-dependent dehydrogenase (short-subunit alcohol dehydrogenase family)